MSDKRSVRTRTMTERGESYHYDSYVKQCRKLESDILKRLTCVENLINSDLSDPSLVRSELKHVDDLQRQFLFVIEKARDLFTKQAIKSEFLEWSEKVDCEIFFVKSS